MDERPEIWLLARGEEPVAELLVEQRDRPWVRGRVVPWEGFGPLRQLLDREQRLAAQMDEAPDAWAGAHEELRRQVRLIGPDGREAPNFLLHIDGRRARWRSGDPRSGNRLADQIRITGPMSSRPRSRRRASGAAAVLMLVLLGLPVQALGRPLRHQRSANWAGYAVTVASSFRSASGSWTQPSATCDQPYPTYSAFWVGLGGFKRSSRALEQIGTEVDCTAGGRRRAYAWYELVPAGPVRLALPVRPGDRVAAHVSARGQRVTLRLQNITTGRVFSKSDLMRSPDTGSAEWIAEAPSSCDGAGQCQPLPLTDFGVVQFAGARAITGAGHAGTISDPEFVATELTLASGAPVLGPDQVGVTGTGGSAVPGSLSGDGTSFTVTVHKAQTPPGPVALAAGDMPRHLQRAAGIRPAADVGEGW